MNKCIEKYRLDTNNIEKEKILNYWIELFPERKQREDVERIVKRVSDKKLNDFLENYENENVVIEQIIDLFSDLGKYKCKKKIDKICEKLYDENKWVSFYTPLLYKNMEVVIEQINASAILADVDALLLKVLTDITDKLSGQSYRVLAGALNNAAKQGLLIGKNPEERGKYFSDVLLKDESYLKELYLNYPELYKVMDRTVCYNLNYILEIINNTEKEFNMLSKKLGEKKELGKLRSIHLGTGDSHNNGKTVAGLIFDDGQKLMYKPRSLQMEECYCEFIDWINANVSESTGLSYCRVHTLEDAGWVEFVENSECESEAEVKAFYQKMGELLCILYTLSSKDFHCENVIARGEQPILIDMETLIHVDELEKKQEWDVIEEKIYDFLNHSVYSTALLPTVLQNYNTEDCMEVGGISSGRKRISPFKVQVLKNVGSDKISIENEYQEVPLNQNLPIYKGEQIGAIGYFAYIKDSFVKMYQWVKNHKEEYTNKINEVFGNVKCRVIYKTTNNYTQLLNTSYHPSLLHNEVDREVYFHRIGLLYNEKDNLSILYRDEIKSMMNGDVPVYFMQSDGNRVYNADGKDINIDYIKTPLNRIEEKINKMSELDLKRQISLIYFTFVGCEMETDMPSGTGVSFVGTRDDVEVCNFIEESKKIAEEISNRAFTDTIQGERQISWFGFQGMGKKGYGITPVGWDLYKGNCGIALFYFRLAEVTKEVQYLQYAKDILCSVEKTFKNALREEYKVVGAGAFTGVASYLYIFYKMLEHNWITESEQESRLEIVEQLLDYLEDSIHEVEQVDVLTGVAGILGTLVSLYPYTNGTISKKIKSNIANAAEILLDRAILIDDRKATWFENGDIGYVHGNAGIMAHLARANHILHDYRISKVIEQALQYEREDHYDREKQEWILRSDTHYFSWCNGIAGIILGKIMLKEAGLQDTLLDKEIVQMTMQLKEIGFGYDSSLCHGDMGTLCVLKYAAKYLNDIELRKGCQNTTINFLQKNIKNGNTFVLEDWGLMTGNAGIGLGILEQAAEDSFLASVLSLK